MNRALYLSHPQVLIDPTLKIDQWSLNSIGRARVAGLAASDALIGTTRIFSSQEVKAMETAAPLAAALQCECQYRPLMHENDRSATGYLPPAEFETMADQFFANPSLSIRGWESAQAAQNRILREVRACLTKVTTGNVLFVGHGAVGTLLFCALADLPISRRYDQPAGGGCYFSFDLKLGRPIDPWRAMEDLL